MKFPLLSDFNKDVIRKYGVVNPDMIGLKDIAKRAMFVIDRSGVVRHREVLEDARNEPDYAKVKQTLAGSRASTRQRPTSSSQAQVARDWMFFGVAGIASLVTAQKLKFPLPSSSLRVYKFFVLHGRYCCCRGGAHASAQSRSRALGARRDPRPQRRVQSRGAGHRQSATSTATRIAASSTAWSRSTSGTRRSTSSR